MKVTHEQKAIPIIVEGKTKYTPAIKLGESDFMPISRHGKVVIYNTAEEAEQYFED